MKNLLEIYHRLKNLGYTLEPFREEDKEPLYHIFREVVDSGSQFPYASNSRQEFYDRFFLPGSHLYVCRSSTHEVIGGFYIRSNFSDGCSHIANAAYMIQSAYRNQGIGTLLVKASLHLAQNLGFHAMQFNKVLSENTSAIRLYQNLGFQIIGTLPKVIRNPDESYQDGYIMYRKIGE